MKIKTIVTVMLILFVVVSVGYMLVTGGSSGSSSSQTAGMDGRTPPQQVIAYYFHGTKRCKTCLQIEASAKETIELTFPDELKDGNLVWKSVDFDEPANEHYATDYQLASASLVLVEFKDGKQIRWRNMEQVWDLVWEKEIFSKYVRDGVSQYLGKL